MPYSGLRSDLIISSQKTADKNIFVIKDPVTGKFFRLKEMEYFIANLFDGKISNKSIADRFFEQFNIKISHNQIDQFGQKMDSLCLLEGTSTTEERVTGKPSKSILGKLLFIKIKAVNPEKIIEKTFRQASILYSKPALEIYFILVIISIVITIADFNDMLYQAKRFFVPEIIPLVWLTIFFVTLIHELSHTYSCRLYGGKVTDMGFLLLYFQPCFYSNVSDAYLFPEKRKRIAVTLAGIVSQIVVWALAVIVWRITSLDNIVNSIAFIIIALSFVGITFNLNPLLKLDGYYFLVDYFEIPNLRQKAFRYLRQRFIGFASGEQKLGFELRERKIFLYYGTASFCYSALLIGYIVYRIGMFINNYLGFFGVALMTAILLYLFTDALSKGKVFQIAYSQRGAILKPGRLMIGSAIIIAIICVLVFVKAPLRITNNCLIAPLEYTNLYLTSPGSAQLLIEKADGEKSLKQYQLTGQDFSVTSILPVLKVGDSVEPGDLIAHIKSNVYESEKLERLANLERAKKQLDLLEKGPQTEEIKQTQDVITQVRLKINKSNQDLLRAESLFARKLIPEDQLEEKRTSNQVLKSELDFYNNQLVLLKRGARPEEIDIARAGVNQLKARLKHLESQLEQTIIESTISGIVTQVNNGDTIIAIARMDSLKVRIDVPEKEISAVAVNFDVRLKVRSYPGLTYSGVVKKIDPLVYRTEGNRAVLRVNAHVKNDGSLLKPGMTGKAKINCGRKPLYWLILWKAVRLIRIEFWSWW